MFLGLENTPSLYHSNAQYLSCKSLQASGKEVCIFCWHFQGGGGIHPFFSLLPYNSVYQGWFLRNYALYTIIIQHNAVLQRTN